MVSAEVIPSGSVSFGTSDKMSLVELDGGRIQLEFVSASRSDVPNRVAVLTKFPGELMVALNKVLAAKEDGCEEFASENFQGRACMFVKEESDLVYAFVVEFSSQTPPTGYLIHMTRKELVDFINKLLKLPGLAHPTD